MNALEGNTIDCIDCIDIEDIDLNSNVCDVQNDENDRHLVSLIQNLDVFAESDGYDGSDDNDK